MPTTRYGIAMLVSLLFVAAIPAAVWGQAGARGEQSSDNQQVNVPTRVLPAVPIDESPAARPPTKEPPVVEARGDSSSASQHIDSLAASPGESSADPLVTALDRRVRQLFRELTIGNTPAIDALEKFMIKKPPPGKTNVLQQIAQQAKLHKQRFGRYVGTEQIDVCHLDEDVILMTYLAKFERFPIVWRFRFQRVPDGALTPSKTDSDRDNKTEAGRWVVTSCSMGLMIEQFVQPQKKNLMIEQFVQPQKKKPKRTKAEPRFWNIH